MQHPNPSMGGARTPAPPPPPPTALFFWHIASLTVAKFCAYSREGPETKQVLYEIC